MDRIFLIQYLIDKHKYSKYLEIGTQNGISFFPIKCKKKIAVDPDFRILFREKIEWYFTNINNLRNRFFEMTSDNFFLNKKIYLKNIGHLDIILIDGLHTFQAALNDSLNSLKYLSKNGTIILHDCLPPHQAAAIYAINADEAILKGGNLSGWNGEWCGDTWKAIVYLKKRYPEELNVFVLDCDYGLGVIQFRKNQNLELRLNKALFDEINKLEYEDLINNPQQLIGLKEKENYKSL